MAATLANMHVTLSQVRDPALCPSIEYGPSVCNRNLVGARRAGFSFHARLTATCNDASLT